MLARELKDTFDQAVILTSYRDLSSLTEEATATVATVDNCTDTSRFLMETSLPPQ